jgi:antitoxin (DNA-binding transcriptional repressor) of toxin-antitoxin stability system
MKTIAAGKFKEGCLALLDHLDPEGLVVTKRGRPVARVLPFTAAPGSLIGALAGKVKIRGDLLSTASRWSAVDGEP